MQHNLEINRKLKTKRTSEPFSQIILRKYVVINNVLQGLVEGNHFIQIENLILILANI